ncbi:2-dehydropantoate 2-reductase [Alkalihalobacillus sp. LMS39]|uniref:2-dehydropantoate 2-reductase n=1 Tax=Alkalihalobacillus sp. LMS39 TaxID=2924032 RepID=UPI001FB51D61|nr:2-dehydropantoate 2-reductase [Alkalihalobacillus sp. LMS39]UOE92940.1 2-dehydropantoate 2-reductase [Alkalihalobacillus sp. LMS39]
MNVWIIGGGSVGLLLASYASKAGAHVTVVTNRKEQAEALRKEGVSLLRNSITSLHPVDAIPFENLSVLQTATIIFLAVKEHQVKRVLDKISKLKTNAPIVFLQNGMNHISLMQQLRSTVYVGIVEHGALKQSDVKVEHTGVGSMKIGHVQGKELELQFFWDKLSRFGYSVVVENKWLEVMKKKLIVNAVVNPLTALYEVKNGELLCDEMVVSIMKKLSQEAIIALQVKDGEDIWPYIIQVCQNTKENKSSMLRDIENGNQTEIEAISGYILREGQKHKINLPYTRDVYNKVKQKERSITDG